MGKIKVKNLKKGMSIPFEIDDVSITNDTNGEHIHIKLFFIEEYLGNSIKRTLNVRFDNCAEINVLE